MKINIEGRNIRPAFSSEEIQKRIKELGKQITEDYKDKDLVCVGILNGAYMFFADLVKEIDLKIEVDFVSLSSYGKKQETSNVVKFHSDVKHSVKGKDVLLIEDVVDTGTTIYKSKIKEHIIAKGAKSCKLCVLVVKPEKLIYPVKIDYLGFNAESDFLVGYGFEWEYSFSNAKDIIYVENNNKNNSKN